MLELAEWKGVRAAFVCVSCGSVLAFCFYEDWDMIACKGRTYGC